MYSFVSVFLISTLYYKSHSYCVVYLKYTYSIELHCVNVPEFIHSTC